MAIAGSIGRLSRVPLREVWPHEARDLTPWLAQNLDVVSDAIGCDLSLITPEHATGSFFVDLVCEDGSGRTVVVENQLGSSDHDHLGKVLTYLAAVGAEAAVWIVPDARAEHVKAVGWLNETGAADFWLVKLEAVRIGDSDPAPILTLIVGPSEEQRDAGETKKDIEKEKASRFDERQAFWTDLLDRAKDRIPRFRNISPSSDSWINASAGSSSLNWSFNARRHDSAVQLNIEGAAAIYERLLENRSDIDARVGTPVVWSQKEGRSACRIIVPTRGGYRDETDRDETYAGLIDAMERLQLALEPYLSDAIGAARTSD